MKTKRYVVHNAQLGQDVHLNKIREPWKVIDTTTNKTVDEFASGRAARSMAAHYNKYGLFPRIQGETTNG